MMRLFERSKKHDELVDLLKSMMSTPSSTECALSRQRLDQAIHIQKDVIDELKKNRDQITLHKAAIEKIDTAQQDFKQHNIIERVSDIEHKNESQKQVLEQLNNTLTNLNKTISEVKTQNAEQIKYYNKMCEEHVEKLDEKYSEQYKTLDEKIIQNQIATGKPIAWSNHFEKILVYLIQAALIAAAIKLVSI